MNFLAIAIAVGAVLFLFTRRSSAAPTSAAPTSVAPPVAPGTSDPDRYTDPRMLTEAFPDPPPPFPITRTVNKQTGHIWDSGPGLWRSFAQTYGAQYNVPPALILAIIWNESSGDASATNPRDVRTVAAYQNASCGLMQVTRICARDVDEEALFLPPDMTLTEKQRERAIAHVQVEGRDSKTYLSEQAAAIAAVIDEMRLAWLGTSAGVLYPDNNIRCGTKYLRKLFDAYTMTGRWFDVCAAYNLGPTEWRRLAAARFPLPSAVESYATKAITRANLGMASRL